MDIQKDLTTITYIKTWSLSFAWNRYSNIEFQIGQSKEVIGDLLHQNYISIFCLKHTSIQIISSLTIIYNETRYPSSAWDRDLCIKYSVGQIKGPNKIPNIETRYPFTAWNRHLNIKSIVGQIKDNHLQQN